MSDDGTCPDELVFFCMSTIESYLKGGTSKSAASDYLPLEYFWDGQRALSAQYSSIDFPVFVTWNKRSFVYDEKDASIDYTEDGKEVDEDDEDVSLRGCIGTFAPMRLEEGLREYAITAAFKDTRFSPITKDELPFLQCGVSLLTPMEPASDPLDWILGKHGIHITFHVSSRRYSGTYLPEVPLAQGWSKEEAIHSLIRKAGFRGKVERGDEVWRGIELQVYESEKCKRNWAQYLGWKKTRGG